MTYPGEKKILMSGNEAIAEGAIQAGCSFYAGYPITPQNELIAYMARHLPPAGGVFIQAESELAAINMVFAAAAAGSRAMTSSSSPGISLKQEGISYIAGAELPAVIVNIMRGGPGLGNIWPAQSDYFQATRGGGHGDYRCIVLAPSSVQEAYDLMLPAFELADQYRNPAIILGDGILGQMMEPVLVAGRWSLVAGKRKNLSAIRYPLSAKKWALTGCKGRKPNIVKSFYMKEGDLEEFNLRLQKKYRMINEKEQRCDTLFLEDAEVILVAYGTMARIAKGAVTKLREDGRRVGLIRPITLWPFPDKAFKRLAIGARHNTSAGVRQRFMADDKRLTILVIEMSYGQMLDDVRLAVNCRVPVEFLGRSGGGMSTEEDIVKKINHLERTRR
ncbi:MAG: 3-methyl-2-oxobutanoate dehydrogenase subunit VorB [Candidatus Omnitrophota bacterium]